MQTMLEIRIYFCLWIYRLSMHGHHSSAMETDMTERLKTGEFQYLLSNDRVRILLRPDTDLETNRTETTFPSGKQPAQSESKTSISSPFPCKSLHIGKLPLAVWTLSIWPNKGAGGWYTRHTHQSEWPEVSLFKCLSGLHRSLGPILTTELTRNLSEESTNSKDNMSEQGWGWGWGLCWPQQDEQWGHPSLQLPRIQETSTIKQRYRRGSQGQAVPGKRPSTEQSFIFTI